MITPLQQHRRMVIGLIKTSPEWAARRAAEQAWRDAHVVYFIQQGTDGLIKIGCTRDIAIRIEQLQASQAMPLRLIGWTAGGFAEEKRLHAVFADAAVGHEWFTPTDALIEYAAANLRTTPHPKPGPRPYAEVARAQHAARRLWNIHGRAPKATPAAVGGQE